MKIAVLRLTDVVAESRRGKAADLEVQQRAEALQKSVADQERVALLAEAEARKATDLNDAQTKGSHAAKLRREAEHFKSEAEITLDEMRRQLLEDVLSAVQPHIQKLAEAHQADLVLLSPNPGIAYVNPAIDLTDDLLQRLDAESPPSPSRATSGGERHAKKKT